MIEFRLLGPVEMCIAGVPQPVPGSIQRGLLASLLVNANHTVPAATLRAELWGDGCAGDSGNTLYAHISRLRKRLRQAEPERKTPRLQTVEAGYRLVVEDDQVDGHRFVAAVERLRRHAAEIYSSQLIRGLHTELSRWRGPALGGAVGGPIRTRGAQMFEQIRHEAQLMLFDAELSCGRHSRIQAELRDLVEQYSPYLEQFSERLMVALYRSGRQVEALQAFQRTARRLAERGQQPGTRLVEVHRMILNQSPWLDPAQEATGVLQPQLV